jgi:succinate dehydrogenase/fumarate reductase cytochrome b subunit
MPQTSPLSRIAESEGRITTQRKEISMKDAFIWGGVFIMTFAVLKNAFERVNSGETFWNALTNYNNPPWLVALFFAWAAVLVFW